MFVTGVVIRAGDSLQRGRAGPPLAASRESASAEARDGTGRMGERGIAMSSILDTIQQQLGPGTIQQMSAALGADPSATSSAVSMALPALLGGLSHNASTPHGAAALDRALGDHDGSILDQLGGGGLGGLLGGGGGIGGAILGHIFGGKRGAVEQGVGQASGLNAAQVAQLLAMLAPIVMGALGKMKRERGIDASTLPQVLPQAAPAGTPSAGGFDLSSILDSNHDGQIADDVGNLGKSILGGIFGKK
jgi:hypothetical protein